jgi:hypothetical protein
MQSTTTPAETDSRIEDIQSPGLGAKGSQLFPELVRARFRRFVREAGYGQPWGVPRDFAPRAWQEQHKRPRQARGDGGDAESDAAGVDRSVRELMGQFEDTVGEISSVHWCTTTPSAVALTVRRRPFLRVFSRDPEYRLHRASDWLTPEHAPVSELLHHCDALAIKVGQVLHGTTEKIAMQWLFSTEAYLLGLIEQRQQVLVAARPDANGRAAGQEHPQPATRSASRAKAESPLMLHARNEVLEIEKYYDRAANKSARLVYLRGMIAGLVLMAALLASAAWLVDHIFEVVKPQETPTRLFFAACMGGAVGAVISVLRRMKQDDFKLDYEVGHWQSFWLGSFRPFIGAAFGLTVYFAIKSGLVQLPTPAGGQEFYFVVLLAFAAGFSERWTQVVMGSAERTVEAAIGGADATPAPAQRPPATPQTPTSAAVQ